MACGNSALAESKKINDEALIAEANMLIGYAHEANGRYKEALNCFLIASDLSKKNKVKPKLAQCYTAMGVIYWYQGFFDKAEEYYKKNIEICLELNDMNGLGASYGNLAILHDENKEIDKALVYYKKALAIFENAKRPAQTAACLDNMSLIFKQKDDFSQARSYNLRSYKIRESLHDSIGMLASMGNLGSIFIAQKDPDQAIPLSLKVLSIASRLGAKEDMKSAYYNLKDAYELKQDYKSANAIINKLMDLKDSLRNLDNASEIAELEAKFKNKEKEVELAEVKLTQELKEAENAEKLKRKNYSILILSIVGVFILLLAILLLKRFKEKKQVAEEFSEKNKAIEIQKKIIDTAYHELSEKNKDITDSIKYAKRIQEAIFPSQAYFSKLLPQAFAYFRPKDIVSGDFYWVDEGLDGSVLVAVVDCTGHGVPGAFMSIVGFNLLNKAIHENKCTDPADILNQVNIDLNETLKQTLEESAVKDGMEISLCKWDPRINKLEFAGANTIVYHISGTQINIVKGNKHPIGSFYGEALKKFQTIDIHINPGDCVYLFSDGFADQFGGEKGKKYKYKQLEEFLLANSAKSIQEQEHLLNAEFERWKGPLEQVDDVCVIGIRF
ncbi:MAG: protein serine/threonine phosphatase [Bacteroidota bacterium]|jgi:serine phosphatase RsbU (regulator of sigma subunit)/tetratricopeptide (TPR) repeat protein|nr:protein serine/threonine phosphatase [Bacteroidota bacterium]